MAEAGLTERALAAHAAWFADAAGSSTEGVRSSRQAEHLAFARAERANIDAALAWSAAHDPLLGLRIVNGFGWAWIVLGDSRGAQRILAALDAAGDAAADPATAPARCCSRRGSRRRRTSSSSPASTSPRPAELADAIDDVDLQARCGYYLAYVVSHDGEFAQALELTERSGALYAGLDRPWDQAANWLFAARAAISAGDRARAVDARDQVEHWLQSVDDPWLHVRREAMLGELARLEQRFDDAVVHIGRAAETSGRLGFLQTEAYQVSSLGRAQCQAGDYETGAATLALAIEKAEATGDVRLAALARVHLGRVLRALGQDAAARAALEAATALAPRRRRAASRPRSASACSRRSTPRMERPAPSSGSPRSSTTPASTTTPRSRSSPSTRSRASPPKRATSPPHGTCARQPTGAWEPRRTSSPSSTEPTLARSGRSA